MNDILELLKYTLPSIIVLIIAYYMMKAFIKTNNKNNEMITRLFEKYAATKTEPKKNRDNTHFERLQLQAHERMTLFLERINPVNLIPRVLPGKKTVLELQMALLQSIREEYEHNLSQQIYINQTVWELIKAAKENTVQLINNTAKSFNRDDNATLLANKILTQDFNKENNPVENAITALKSDLQKRFSS